MTATRLEASNLSVYLAARAIVDHCDLALRSGELTILVGPNGAGKTTLLRALAGLIPTQGDVRVNGADIRTLNARARAQQIAYLPQGHVFHWPLSVENIVALGRTPHADAFTQLTAHDRAAIRDAMTATETTSFASHSILSLSGGERARVALARALATNAAIMLADEPTAALDARHQLKIMELLRGIARNGGAVLAIVHDLSLAARFADRILVMKNGRIVSDDAPERALTKECVADVFGLSMHRIVTADGTLLIPAQAL